MYANESEEVIYRYKYRDFDDNDGNLKIISDGTLKFSSPMDFNDPFDCFPAYDPTSITELYKKRPDLIKSASKAKGESPADRIRNKGKVIKGVQRLVDSGEWTKALMSNVSIFCMSRNPTNPLMWAHYANNHRGFLVEFRISMQAPDQELNTILPHPVVYSLDRPLLNWGELGGKVEPYFLTKSLDWEYEEEERVIDVKNGPGFYPYSRESFLSSVTAGIRIQDDDYEKLRKAVNKASIEIGREIPLYQAKLSPYKYKVYIPGHPNQQVSFPN